MTTNDKMTAEQVCEAIEALKFKAKEIEAAYANYQDLETRERQIQTQKAEAKNKLHKLIDKDRPLIKSVLKQPPQISKSLFKSLPSEEVPIKPKSAYELSLKGCRWFVNGKKMKVFLSQFCQQRGFKPTITYNAIAARLKKGWAFEPAVFIPSLSDKLRYKSFTDAELSSCIKKYGDISLLDDLYLVKDRIYNLCWDFYKSITTPAKQAKGA